MYEYAQLKSRRAGRRWLMADGEGEGLDAGISGELSPTDVGSGCICVPWVAMVIAR